MFGNRDRESNEEYFEVVECAALKLNRETVIRLGKPSAKPGEGGKRTEADNCPPSTRTRVTAHCC